MTGVFGVIQYIPESIAIVLIGLLAMACMSITAVVLGVIKIRSTDNISVWVSANPLSLALLAAGKTTRNLFIAYALIYPFFHDSPDVLTLCLSVLVVIASGCYSVKRFYSARKITGNKKTLAGKEKTKHERYVKQLKKDIDSLRGISCLLRR